jgi:hypothetical protein
VRSTLYGLGFEFNVCDEEMGESNLRLAAMPVSGMWNGVSEDVVEFPLVCSQELGELLLTLYAVNEFSSGGV